MNGDDLARRRTEATEEFNRHEGRADGVMVISSLAGGLTILRDAMYARMFDEVQAAVGRDSILMPVSLEKAERLAKTEIEIFQVVVAAAWAERWGYVRDGPWCLDWLARLRLGGSRSDPAIQVRLEHYRTQPADPQRLSFTNVLAETLPSSRRAPLVLFRLHPLAVQIATSLAFGDHKRARDVRAEQMSLLPSIGDCHECHGKLVENGERCRVCGNPLWHFNWLVAAD